MAKIKDILKLDLNEDLRDVIDLEDHTEKELKYEIENYIVTEKIAQYIDDLISLYKSNIKETGVWISGFYGSGKSYFGKMFGYLLENKMIEGTEFRERFIQRLAGIRNQGLIENAIRSLIAYKTRVVFLDIAKQNTTNGFAWVLFKNFLRSLGFLDDVFGYMEYGLFLQDKYDSFLADVKNIHGKAWQEIRRNPISAAKVMRDTLIQTIYSQEEYNEIKQYHDNRIKDYDTTKFKEEISYYLEKYSDERIVFIIDEVSEAISRNKIDLLELEGISEALSAIPRGRVWTIAIAQEKLDDVIHNANLRKQDLNKVTDRFKTKIHLSSEEVDTVIRKRLLLKQEDGEKLLNDYYSKNSGLIADATSLNGSVPTKTVSKEDFTIYYPFHRYQFDLLQNFLFAVNQKAKTGGTERGMIIAAHSVLKQIKDEDLFALVTGDRLVDGGKKLLDSELERKFVKADKILKEKQSPIDGNRLIKTIYLLNESEIIPASAEVVTKLYLAHPEKYYDVKPAVEQALIDLTNANLLLEKNGVYKIASDLEQKLIEEMKEITVEFHYKKRELVETLKKQSFLQIAAKCSFENNPYNFHITTIEGDELQYSTNKYLKFQLANPYTVELESKEQYIEKMKFETQNDIDRAVLIPDMEDFERINHLIETIYRYGVIIDRYKNDDDEKIRSIIKDFEVNKTNHTKSLDHLIEKAYKNGTLVYNFEEYSLTESIFSKIIQDIQHKIIARTYPDRLPFQLSEETAKKILKEINPSKLKTNFSGAEFEFFDRDGNFIGEHLKVVEKITGKIPSTSFVSGDDLERELALPPYAYSYGTIATVLAVLMRAGRLALKSNTGIITYDYKSEEAWNVFSRSRDFKRAAFKLITSTISMAEKQQIVDYLKELQANRILDLEFSYSTNNIELVSLISHLAKHFIERIEERQAMIPDFKSYFPQAEEYLEILKPFNVKITDANYKAKAQEFLNGFRDFKQAIRRLQAILDFIEKSLKEAERFKAFVDHIAIELKKLGGRYADDPIFELKKQFDEKFLTALIENFNELKIIFQKIKDRYYNLMKAEHDSMTQLHIALKETAEKQKKEIAKISETLNRDLLNELDELVHYANAHICNNLAIEYEIACQNCHFTLNEIISANQSVGVRENAIEQIKFRIKYPPESPGEKPTPKTVKLKAEKGSFTVVQYRSKLEEKLNQLKQLNDDDIVVVE